MADVIARLLFVIFERWRQGRCSLLLKVGKTHIHLQKSVLQEPHPDIQRTKWLGTFSTNLRTKANCSWLHQLLSMRWSVVWARGEVYIVYLDFSIVLYMHSHCILTAKLLSDRLFMWINRWLENWMDHWAQRVINNGDKLQLAVGF